jgi:MFS family permease
VVGYDEAQGVYQLEDQKTFDDKISKGGSGLQAIFLIGWAVGGFLFGILGDRIGRTGTMIATILIYAVFTGLSGLAQDMPVYGFMRFMTALGVGGEWAAGAALVAEVFPARSRPMALGLLQACSTVGNMLASVVTLALFAVSWRWAYAVGAIPALLVLWIRRNVKEPEKWESAKQSAASKKELGNIAELFTDPVLRRHTIAAVMMAAAGVGALWGVGFFSTDLVRHELKDAGWSAALIAQRVPQMFFLQNFGAFFGIMGFAAYAERVGRRKAFFLSFVLAWISILVFFWMVSGKGKDAFTWAAILAPIMGACTLGPFSGYSVYFPELFPTRLRSTGCGFCYNAARILAAAAPFALGYLQVYGLAVAATIVSSVYILGFIGTAMAPETLGKPLPE